MRAWGNSHPEVASRVKAVDTKRLDYLAQLAKLMGASAPQAKLWARMGYAQLIGVQHLQPHITAKEAAKMDQALSAMFDNQLKSQA